MDVPITEKSLFITPNIIELNKSLIESYYYQGDTLRNVLKNKLFGSYDKPRKYGSKIINNLCRNSIQSGYIKDKLFTSKDYTHLYLLVKYDNIRGGGGKNTGKTRRKGSRPKKIRKRIKTSKNFIQKAGNNNIISIINDNSLSIKGFMITKEFHDHTNLEIICVSEQTDSTHRLKASLLIDILKQKVKLQRKKYIYLSAIISAVPYYLNAHNFLLVPLPYNIFEPADAYELISIKDTLVREQSIFKNKEISYDDLVFEYSCGVPSGDESDSDESIDDESGYESDPDVLEQKKRVKRCEDDGFDMIWIP